ncbi:hypothetical protein BC826DRAFT_340898 [Russula brevipes]|nr:hypothetical protein BC826DRAFT_340898 [Russula brevipes]
MVSPRDLSPLIAQQSILVLVRFWHAVDGLYIWEFFTTLDYEFAVIRGRRPYRWSIWVYSLARVAGLMSVILNIVGMDVMVPMNCQLWISFQLFFCYTSSAAGSLLIVLRIVAIWIRNKLAVATAFGLWGISVAFFIQSIARGRAVWAPTRLRCVNIDTQTSAPTLIAMLVTDLSLLLLMLVGLLHMRRDGGGTFGLSQLLWKQGLIWLLIATIAEAVPVIFIALNLDVQWNLTKQIFQAPSLYVMTIAGTRMHRSLVDFANRTTDMYDILHPLSCSRSCGRRSFSAPSSPQKGLPASKTERARTTTISISQMEAAIFTDSEQLETLQTSDR